MGNSDALIGVALTRHILTVLEMALSTSRGVVCMILAKSLKHIYKINKRVGVAILKEQLMKGILDPETDMEALCEKLKNDLKRNLSLIRPNRSFSRPQKGRLKFGCTMRRSI